MASTILDRLQASASSVLLRAVAAVLLVAPAARAQSGCSGDINGDGRVDGFDLSVVLSQWGNCAPSIASVSPSHGSVLGGTVITITGAGLASTSAVRVGGVLCTNLQVLSATQVRATTPAGAAGQATIEVTTPGGTSLAPTPFNYVLQAVTSITPSVGPFAGGTPITIAGQFLAGTTSVTIGGVPATNVVAVNATTVTAVTPAGSLGAADVVVIGAKGTITLPGGFTYLSVNTPPWATLIDALPDPAVVTDPTLRNAITATGWAWRVRDNASQIEMLLVPPGTFNMGCSASNQNACYPEETPVRTVTLTNAFYMGRYEVTQAQWTARMVWNPSFYQFPSVEVPAAQVPNRPVDSVQWGIIHGFLSAAGLRLPTEAEWEYAYRAGTTTAFHSMPGFPNGTNDDAQLGNISWNGANAGVQPRPVGGKVSNGFGLHDMSGNLSEWCSDWYGAYPAEPQTNPTGPTTGVFRVVRGGVFYGAGDSLRSSARQILGPGMASEFTGFRVVRNP